MAMDAAFCGDSLDLFACPNPECDWFNRFGGGNLSVAERMGKGKAIRRLYCNRCQHRFSERSGSLMHQTKIPEQSLVRILKCLTYGCSVEATSDICEVDPRTVERVLNHGGQRAEDFHCLQLDQLARSDHPPQVVELDEMHAKVSRPPAGKKGGARPTVLLVREVNEAVLQAETGFTWHWTPPRGS